LIFQENVALCAVKPVDYIKRKPTFQIMAPTGSILFAVSTETELTAWTVAIEHAQQEYFKMQVGYQLDQSAKVRHTHTHTQRERERER